MRLREDELFLQRLTQDLPRSRKAALQKIDLNLKDAPIRLRIPLDQLCNTPFNPEDPAIEKIRKALTRHAEAGLLEAIVLPIAIGNHIDHLTVREAALPLLATHPSAFYEDLPYAATHPTSATDLDNLLATANHLGQPLTSILYPAKNATDAAPEDAAEAAADRIARKRHLVLGYASQIEQDAANTISAYATNYNGAERLWANPQWSSSLQ